MPRNRADVERSLKTDAILDIAVRQLHDGGYSTLSMAAIARELGVAQNAVYWYFSSKDHLLVAVARRQLERHLADPPAASTAPYDQAVWLLDQLEEARPVREAVLVRSAAAADVDGYRAEVHAMLHEIVEGWLEGEASDPDRPFLAEAILAAAEGLLVQRADREQRNRILRVGLKRIIGPGATRCP